MDKFCECIHWDGDIFTVGCIYKEDEKTGTLYCNITQSLAPTAVSLQAYKLSFRRVCKNELRLYNINIRGTTGERKTKCT